MCEQKAECEHWNSEDNTCFEKPINSHWVYSEGSTWECGIRTMETYTRNTLDISAVTAVKSLTHLPVVVDPSHATGRIEMIEPMSLASIMAGCDGLEIEVHPSPCVVHSLYQYIAA